MEKDKKPCDCTDIYDDSGVSIESHKCDKHQMESIMDRYDGLFKRLAEGPNEEEEENERPTKEILK